MVEIGSYLFKVASFNILTKTITFACLNFLTNQCEEIVVNLSTKPTYSMGRRANNEFARDDQHMSGFHAKIYFFNGKFILEDMGSTNG
jgi:pSer/pThr/pTyr-binding forkhead associated (FHA) protein